MFCQAPTCPFWTPLRKHVCRTEVFVNDVSLSLSLCLTLCRFNYFVISDTRLQLTRMTYGHFASWCIIWTVLNY